MSRKHHAKHPSRGVSNYPLRLQARGESSATVRMPFYDKNGRPHETLDAARRRGLLTEEGE